MSQLMEREAMALMQVYKRQPVVFVRGDGCWLFDESGNAFLDCVAGVAVVSVGHANARVTEAVTEQLSKLGHVSNLYYTIPQVELAERMRTLSGLSRVFFSNCGATANETAIKLARRWGQKQRGPQCFEIISLDGSFHGRTLATLAATGQPAKQATFQPLPQGFRQVSAGDMDALASAVSSNTAAIMVETIQGEGGVVPLAADYLKGIRRLCDRMGILMIVDDVQAGLGRTGSWFSWQSLGFAPDVATLAKALGNGLPIGACLATDEIAAAFEPGDHATTFGGGPVVCRAALAVLDEIEQRDLLRNCKERSEQLRNALVGLRGVQGVRGRGLLIAAVLGSDNAAKVTARALEQGLIVNNVRPDAIRLVPPLCITSDEVDQVVERLDRAIGASA